jgi:uncharacterized membrane protein YfcA
MAAFGELHFTTAAIAMGAMAIGSAFQAALGIGMALVVVPILALIDPVFVPGPILLAGSILAAITAYRERDAIDRTGLTTALMGLAAGTLVGAIALRYAAGAGVQRVFGCLVLLAVLVSALGVPVTTNTRNLVLGGGAAGVMGTMVGIHGPPISLVFQNAEPRVARAMLGSFFTVAYLGSVLALAAFGLFGTREIVRAIVLLPGVGIGLLLAPLARRFVDRARLRIAILGLAAVSGVLLVLK